MATTLQPWQVLIAAMAGWINRHQQVAIDCDIEGRAHLPIIELRRVA